MDPIASMVAMVVSFPPTIMIIMLVMHRVERRVARQRACGPPPLHVVHGENEAPSPTAVPGGTATAAGAPEDHATPTGVADQQPTRALRLVPTEKTEQEHTKAPST